MGEVLGADPDQLEALAGRFERRAGELASSRSSLSSMLSSVPWVGADAERFRSTWRREQSRHIDLVVDELREMAASLRREAADQRTTSAGVAGGAIPTPGSDPSGLGSADPPTSDGGDRTAGPAAAVRGLLGEPAGTGPDDAARTATGAIDTLGVESRRVLAAHGPPPGVAPTDAPEPEPTAGLVPLAPLLADPAGPSAPVDPGGSGGPEVPADVGVAASPSAPSVMELATPRGPDTLAGWWS